MVDGRVNIESGHLRTAFSISAKMQSEMTIHINRSLSSKRMDVSIRSNKDQSVVTFSWQGTGVICSTHLLTDI